MSVRPADSLSPTIPQRPYQRAVTCPIAEKQLIYCVDAGVQGAVNELGVLLNNADKLLGQDELTRLPTALTLFILTTFVMAALLIRRHW